MTSHVNALADRLMPILEDAARRRATLTYAELAHAADVAPPHSIHKTTEALQTLMAVDAAAGRPLLAAVVVSAKRGGAPAPGFFQTARAVGVFFGPDHGPQAETFHAIELDRVWDAYGSRAR
ncbi:MAG: hypothetical protein HQ481_21815 [Alphaproteobacteria bacterium]|nr:hypothetical protein [Alphaproteobacteria bacterium]